MLKSLFTSLSSRYLLLRLHKKIILHLSSTTLEQKSLLKIKNLIQQNLDNAVDSLKMCYIVIMNLFS
jgi:DNA-directed RNA polymerase